VYYEVFSQSKILTFYVGCKKSMQLVPFSKILEYYTPVLKKITNLTITFLLVMYPDIKVYLSKI